MSWRHFDFTYITYIYNRGTASGVYYQGSGPDFITAATGRAPQDTPVHNDYLVFVRILACIFFPLPGTGGHLQRLAVGMDVLQASKSHWGEHFPFPDRQSDRADGIVAGILSRKEG